MHHDHIEPLQNLAEALLNTLKTISHSLGGDDDATPEGIAQGAARVVDHLAAERRGHDATRHELRALRDLHQRTVAERDAAQGILQKILVNLQTWSPKLGSLSADGLPTLIRFAFEHIDTMDGTAEKHHQALAEAHKALDRAEVPPHRNLSERINLLARVEDEQRTRAQQHERWLEAAHKALDFAHVAGGGEPATRWSLSGRINWLADRLHHEYEAAKRNYLLLEGEISKNIKLEKALEEALDARNIPHATRRPSQAEPTKLTLPQRVEMMRQAPYYRVTSMNFGGPGRADTTVTVLVQKLWDGTVRTLARFYGQGSEDTAAAWLKAEISAGHLPAAPLQRAS